MGLAGLGQGQMKGVRNLTHGRCFSGGPRGGGQGHLLLGPESQVSLEPRAAPHLASAKAPADFLAWKREHCPPSPSLSPVPHSQPETKVHRIPQPTWDCSLFGGYTGGDQRAQPKAPLLAEVSVGPLPHQQVRG